MIPKTKHRIILTASLLVIAVLAAGIVFYLIYYHNYVSVEATVIETILDNGLGQGGNDSSTEYIVVEYFHNGEIYRHKILLELFDRSYSVDDKIWIKCNPRSFSDVENQNTLKWLCIAEGVLILWTGGLIFAIIKKHKKGNKTNESQG